MAMTVCIECGKPVSTDALSCPSCGKPLKPLPPPPPKKKGMPWYVGCLIAFAAMFVLIPIIGILTAIAIPSFVKARERAQESTAKACMSNLRQISIAKETLAVEGNYQPGDTIDPTAMEQALGQKPTCPTAGQYTYGTFGQEPSCSRHGMLKTSTDVEVEQSEPPPR